MHGDANALIVWRKSVLLDFLLCFSNSLQTKKRLKMVGKYNLIITQYLDNLQTISFLELIFTKKHYWLLKFLLRKTTNLCPYNSGLIWIWFGSHSNFHVVIIVVIISTIKKDSFWFIWMNQNPKSQNPRNNNRRAAPHPAPHSDNDIECGGEYAAIWPESATGAGIPPQQIGNL